MQRHEEFLAKLDNAIHNVFIGKYRALYDEAIDLLRRFNQDTDSSYGPASLEDFQARVMRQVRIQDIPRVDDKERRAEFLLPKVLTDATDLAIMRKVMEWVSPAAE